MLLRKPIIPTWDVIKRGLLGRCPQCGRGKLYRAYLKAVDSCAECGEAFGHIRADDGPAWLTVIVVGHIVVPLALEVETVAAWPYWLAMTVWPSLTLALTLTLLPRAKGVFLAAIWANKAPGSETDA